MPEDDHSTDDTDNCIIVARPVTAIPQSTQPTALPTNKQRDKLDKDVQKLHDMLGSEDELVLPTRARVGARSTHTAASRAEPMTVLKSIECDDCYQSLLSQFNLTTEKENTRSKDGSPGD